MPCDCTVNVVAISFNHDPLSSTADALNVRRNFKDTIPVPEWTAGKTLPEESPAAYAIAETSGQTITIKAKFTFSSANCSQAEVRADGGGILGAIAPQTVTFSGPVSAPEFVPMPLHRQIITNGGIRVEDIAWNWQYRCSGEESWRPIETTHHRIYVVLERPKRPWQQQPFPNNQNPWTDALEYACVWACGKTTRDDAAAAITERVNGNLGLTYDVVSGAPHYVSTDGVFELTRFLDYLKTGVGFGNIVGCTDCAAIVTTFSNLVGCDLHASRMAREVVGNDDPIGFFLTPIKAIGQPGFGCPNWGCSFRFHEVGWTGGADDDDPLFDACVVVNGGSDPWAPPYTALLPVEIVFSTNPGAPLPLSVPYTAHSYKERLGANDAAGIGSCQPIGPWGNSRNGRRLVR